MVLAVPPLDSESACTASGLCGNIGTLTPMEKFALTASHHICPSESVMLPITDVGGSSESEPEQESGAV